MIKIAKICKKGEKMRLEKCIKCGHKLKDWKEDKFRFWYKCSNPKCSFFTTEPKALPNKKVENIPQTK